jgi:hypothetical protein
MARGPLIDTITFNLMQFHPCQTYLSTPKLAICFLILDLSSEFLHFDP